MGQNTAIEWADHTWNTWMGCAKVSPACDHCYAEDLMDTRYGKVSWGAGAPRVRTKAHTWNQLDRWNRAAAAEDARPFVFSLSLGDVWDNEVDPAWRKEMFDKMRQNPRLVMLLLSKRIGNALKMAEAAGGLPGNVALGATFCNDEEYQRDAGKLQQAGRELGAIFTFGSFEPLLGPVRLDERAPDWIIVGGESGKMARGMDLQWAREMREKSNNLGRVFNFKQVGGRKADKGGPLLDGVLYHDRPAVPPMDIAA